MRCASNIVFLNADCLICRKQFGDAEMRFETRRELAERPLISEICSQFPHPFSIQSLGEKWIENVQHLERNSQKENNFYKLAEALQIMWNEVDKVFKATITVFWPKCWQDHWQGVVSGGKLRRGVYCKAVLQSCPCCPCYPRCYMVSIAVAVCITLQHIIEQKAGLRMNHRR